MKRCAGKGLPVAGGAAAAAAGGAQVHGHLVQQAHAGGDGHHQGHQHGGGCGGLAQQLEAHGVGQREGLEAVAAIDAQAVGGEHAALHGLGPFLGAAQQFAGVLGQSMVRNCALRTGLDHAAHHTRDTPHLGRGMIAP